MQHAKCYIENYPRPQFVRGHWISLDGKWDFAFDENNEGENRHFFQGFERQYEIVVPFTYECEASGVGTETPCDHVWYQRKFVLTKKQLEKRCLLNFDGVDYTAKVWLNGNFIGTMASAHVINILSNLPISADKSAAAIQGGMVPFYLVLFAALDLHIAIGLYRVGVKFGILNRENRLKWRKYALYLVIGLALLSLATHYSFATMAI